MHLSTVKVSIDFGIDWLRSSVLFLISNRLFFFFFKLCVSHSFASFCIYLVRPSPVSVPHPTWHRTYTDSHEYGKGPTMNRETVYLGETIGVSVSLDSAIGTGFYKLLSVFAISYTLCMSKFYMPTLINNRNTSKTAPISLYFVPVSSWGSLPQRFF